MEDLYSTPPDPKEMEAVMMAMMEAWKTDSDYIAESHEAYFRYAVPLMDISNAKRIPPGEKIRTADGRVFMMDTYLTPGGKKVRIGYEMPN